MSQEAFVVDPVRALLKKLDGSQECSALVRRAILRETAILPIDHRLREKVTEFLQDVDLVTTSIVIGGTVNSILPHLTETWDILLLQIRRAMVH